MPGTAVRLADAATFPNIQALDILNGEDTDSGDESDDLDEGEDLDEEGE